MQTEFDIKSSEDYCLDIGGHIALCRIKGQRPNQQDVIAYQEKNAAFDSLPLDNKIDLLKRVIAEHQEQNKSYEKGGSTLLACFNSYNLQTNLFRVQLANVGDTRSYLVILNADHSVFEFTQLNLLHNPDPKKNRAECKRVERFAQIRFSDTYRLACGLMQTRGIGDSAAKPYGGVSTPDIYEVTRILSSGQVGLTINASDGIEGLSLSEMISIVSSWSKSQEKLSILASRLVSAAYNNGSDDNISVGIIRNQGSVVIADGHGQFGEEIATSIGNQFYPLLQYHFSRENLSGAPSHSSIEDDTTYFLKIVLTWMLKVWLENKKLALHEVEKWFSNAKNISEFVKEIESDPSFFISNENKNEGEVESMKNPDLYASPVYFFIENTCLNFTISLFLSRWKNKEKHEQDELIELSISQFLTLFKQDFDEITHKALLIEDMIGNLQKTIEVPKKETNILEPLYVFFLSKGAATYSPEQVLLSSLNEHEKFNYLKLDYAFAQYSINVRIKMLNEGLEQCCGGYQSPYKLTPWSKLYNTPFTPEKYVDFQRRKQNEIDNPDYDFVGDSSLLACTGKR